VTEPAISVAFFDTTRRLFGSARSGIAVIFEGDDHRVVGEPPELRREGGSWLAHLGDEGEVRFEPTTEAAEVHGTRTRLCRVLGRVGGRALDCLGAATETPTAPAWTELDATRFLVAAFDEGSGLVAHARRPRGVPGHGREAVLAALFEAGELRTVEEVRISTVYDGDGRQRTAGLELWLAGEEFPHRASGEARAGVSLALEGLRVQLAMLTWRMDGREGAGAYELTVREEERAA